MNATASHQDLKTYGGASNSGYVGAWACHKVGARPYWSLKLLGSGPGCWWVTLIVPFWCPGRTPFSLHNSCPGWPKCRSHPVDSWKLLCPLPFFFYPGEPSGTSPWWLFPGPPWRVMAVANDGWYIAGSPAGPGTLSQGGRPNNRNGQDWLEERPKRPLGEWVAASLSWRAWCPWWGGGHIFSLFYFWPLFSAGDSLGSTQKCLNIIIRNKFIKQALGVLGEVRERGDDYQWH